MANLVGTKGQLVIEKDIRDKLGIKPGAVAIQRVVDSHIEVYFLPPEHNESVAGILAPLIKGKRAQIAAKGWHDIKENAWEEAIREDRLLDNDANAHANEDER